MSEPKKQTYRPTMPSGMTEKEQKIWADLVPVLHESGVIVRLDVPQLRQLCFWYARFESLAAEINAGVADAKEAEALERRARFASNEFHRLAITFGLTPKSRADLLEKLADDNGGEEDPMAEFDDPQLTEFAA